MNFYVTNQDGLYGVLIYDDEWVLYESWECLTEEELDDVVFSFDPGVKMVQNMIPPIIVKADETSKGVH
jgi:hypothetical protein